MAEIARAEDRRRTADVPKEARTSEDARVRRRATEALARIGDPLAADALLERLSDEDDEVVTWAAYGLGFACRGREESHVRALAARAVSLRAQRAGGGAQLPHDLAPPIVAIARAIGRCGAPIAEQVLVAWAKERSPETKDLARAAVLGLGDYAVKKKELGEAAQTALVQAAEDGTSDMAFYGLARAVALGEMIKPRVLAAARASLVRVQDTRIFAIRAMGKCGRDAAPDLAKVVESSEYNASERVEAARALGALDGPAEPKPGEVQPGRVAAAELLGKLVPDKDPFAITALGGPNFALLSTLVSALGDAPPPRATAPLTALAALEAPGEPPAPLARRIADLRCQAAATLARAAWDADVIKKCAPAGSYASDRAKLTALLRNKTLAGERKTAWRALTKSEHLRIREAALEAAENHNELGDLAKQAILEALASDKGGLVGAAADAINAHPERVQALADSERRAGSDPRAPPPVPGREPQRELDKEVAKALRAALDRKWAADLFETRLSLLDAAVAVTLPGARGYAEQACKDPNSTVRERAVKALRALNDATIQCPAPDDPGEAAPELAQKPMPSKIVLQTDAGALTLRLSPDLAPVTAARLTSLAKAGFYKGIVVHRVVPGFVVQLGDPQGDGNGGSGTPLRCETAPAPFAALDVGMALAGRDTGSSQFFVTLSRTPHLDGDYTKVGRAEGDWYSVAEGDVVREVKVEEGQ
jgi:cyclophilin family peptidyl-prolyl cis-trans isomerase